jgi:hypothetical protein
MSEPVKDHLQPVRNYDDLLDRLGDWRAFRGLSNQFVDELGGLSERYVDKVLGPTRKKQLSPMMLDLLLTAFGVQILIVEDPKATAAMARRWEARNEQQVRISGKVSQKVLARARPVILREMREMIEAGNAARVASIAHRPFATAE